jgi:hypothetical protein
LYEVADYDRAADASDVTAEVEHAAIQSNHAIGRGVGDDGLSESAEAFTEERYGH